PVSGLIFFKYPLTFLQNCAQVFLIHIFNLSSQLGCLVRRQSMKKLAGLNFFVALLTISVALISFSGSAQAYTYDDFNGTGINPKLWFDSGPTKGYFFQPGDGYLYFSDTNGGANDQLLNPNPVAGPFSVLMQFSNFQATNNAGSGKAPCIDLLLGDTHTWVATGKWLNVNGQGFQAVYGTGGTSVVLSYILSSADNGWLGIRYNGILGPGGKVDFLYNAGQGWMVLDSYCPNFSQAPRFNIIGWNLYGESLSFQVDQVQVNTPTSSALDLLLLMEQGD
ncbi:MAG TPA: hypothetical protein VIN67_00320, partial [Desulfobaccales bacterium]